MIYHSSRGTELFCVNETFFLSFFFSFMQMFNASLFSSLISFYNLIYTMSTIVIERLREITRDDFLTNPKQTVFVYESEVARNVCVGLCF